MSGWSRTAAGAAALSHAPLADLLTEAGVTTPAYVYDIGAIAAETERLVAAFDGAQGLVAYAVKANSAGSIVRTIAGQGAGADIVSGGELELALEAGIAPERIVMSGVAKTDGEIDHAIAVGVAAIQLESVEEIARVAARARALGRMARVSLRVNPGVAVDSHAHVATGHDAAKFGIARADLEQAWRHIDEAGELLRAVGVSSHVGSMLTSPEPWLASASAVCEVARARRSEKPGLEFVDFGGGFGIDYGERACAPPTDFLRAGLRLLAERGLSDLSLVIEPGRALVGPHGVLVASVVQEKRSGSRRWVMIDAGMNDLIRPALYGARYRIEPLERPPGPPNWRVVGPVCESADDFGDYALGDPVPSRVVIRDAGAYGFTMASEYNGRALPSEVFVASGRVVHVSPTLGALDWVARRLSA
jgi:diaminopimelate decarboxylase